MKSFVRLVMVTIIVMTSGFCLSLAQAQCPEDANDRGECDTLNVTCLDCEQTPGTGPWQPRWGEEKILVEV